LLLSQPKDKKLVYFSSLSIFYDNTRYTQHKRYMEELLKRHFDSYCIVRLGNISWNSNNQNTLINFFKNKIKNKESFVIKNEYRYLVDREEFLYWLNLIPSFNVEMNIVGRRMLVKDIVREIKEGVL